MIEQLYHLLIVIFTKRSKDITSSRSQENAQNLHNDVASQIQLMKFYIVDEQACLV